MKSRISKFMMTARWPACVTVAGLVLYLSCSNQGRKNPFDEKGENWNPPSVTAMSDTTVALSDSFFIHATASDANGTVKKYLWAFDGVNFKDSTDSGRIKTAFTTAGVKTVKVKARDNDGVVSQPDSCAITVLPPPTLISPADSATGQPLTLTLTWSRVSGATAYHVQVSDISTFSTIVAQDSTLTDTLKAVGGLANSTVYYWRVRAKDARGASGWTRAWSFTTIVAAPQTPTLVSPADSATGQPLTPTLTWSTVSGAANYHVQVSTATDFSTILSQDSTLTSASKAISGLTYLTTYYWRVRSRNAGGVSAWTGAWRFTTNITPPAIPIATVNQGSVTVSWNSVTGAISYNLYYVAGATVDKNGTKLTGVTSPQTISGLTYGKQYSFAVSAVNAGGESDLSGIVTVYDSLKAWDISHQDNCVWDYNDNDTLGEIAQDRFIRQRDLGFGYFYDDFDRSEDLISAPTNGWTGQSYVGAAIGNGTAWFRLNGDELEFHIQSPSSGDRQCGCAIYRNVENYTPAKLPLILTMRFRGSLGTSAHNRTPNVEVRMLSSTALNTGYGVNFSIQNQVVNTMNGSTIVDSTPYTYGQAVNSSNLTENYAKVYFGVNCIKWSVSTSPDSLFGWTKTISIQNPTDSGNYLLLYIYAVSGALSSDGYTYVDKLDIMPANDTIRVPGLLNNCISNQILTSENGHDTLYQPATKDFTLCGWVYKSDMAFAGTYATIYSKQASSDASNKLWLRLNSSGYLIADVGTSTGSYSGGGFPIGQWVFVWIRRQSGVVTAGYTSANNGGFSPNALITISDSSSVAVNGSDFRIGCCSYSNLWINGKFDMTVFNRSYAFSNDELAGLYNKGIGTENLSGGP
jgi:hypothetical protein